MSSELLLSPKGTQLYLGDESNKLGTIICITRCSQGKQMVGTGWDQAHHTTLEDSIQCLTQDAPLGPSFTRVTPEPDIPPPQLLLPAAKATSWPQHGKS